MLAALVFLDLVQGLLDFHVLEVEFLRDFEVDAPLLEDLESDLVLLLRYSAMSSTSALLLLYHLVYCQVFRN